jgi:hypothetical protein
MFDTSFGLKTWIFPGLIYGLILFLLIGLGLPYLEGETIEWKVIYEIPIWLAAGLGVKYYDFKKLNKKGRREIGQKTDSREYTGKL